MITALISGSLFRNPECRTSKSGKVFATATLRINDGDGSQYVHVVAFSESAQAELLRLKDGDCFFRTGPVQGGDLREGRRRAEALIVDHRRSNSRPSAASETAQGASARTAAGRHAIATSEMCGLVGARRRAG
jgi:hypothetical protein